MRSQFFQMSKQVVLEVEYISGKDAVKIVKMTTKYLECYINLVDKAESLSGFERIVSRFERSSTVGKKQWNSFACYKEIFGKRKSQLIQWTSLLYYKNASHPNLQQPPLGPVSSHQHSGKTLHQQKDYDSLKAQMGAGIFSNKVFLINVNICNLEDIMWLHI